MATAFPLIYAADKLQDVMKAQNIITKSDL